eukprot:Gb_36255 [translate_table: standard]
MGMCRKPHAVLVPFPVQGHINPMMQLAQKLSSHGFIITFINTHFNHSRIIKANKSLTQENIRFMAIPDGLDEDDTRTDFAKLANATEKTMGPFLHTVIHQINCQEDQHKVTCLIADFFASWALDVAKAYQIPRAAFWPGLISTYAIIYHIPALVSAGAIPSNGIPKEQKMVRYLPSMPAISSGHLAWLIGSRADQEFRFQFWLRNMERLSHLQWPVLCNSFHDLEAPIINIFPKDNNHVGVCPIGPLLPDDIGITGEYRSAISKTKNINPSFWAEEGKCLDWLDRQTSKSVIYVSFGSVTILNERQLEELALGLEATHRPFLWVVRSDLMDGMAAVFPPGFTERTRDRGFFVSWAPQLCVLSHPSIACFLTHCGWNSTLESISMGVPMICWPYYADQFLNRSYVVEEWKIGLPLSVNEDGVIERREIQKAVKRIVLEEEGGEMRKRVVELKDCAMDAVKKGGSSSTNFHAFLNFMKNNI